MRFCDSVVCAQVRIDAHSLKQQEARMGEEQRLPFFMRRADPSVAAWRKVEAAGEDDEAYTAAIVASEMSVPTTMGGLQLKLRQRWRRDQALLTADSLTVLGRAQLRAYRKTIREALMQLAGEARRVGLRL
jgi:hypothetical protein